VKVSEFKIALTNAQQLEIRTSPGYIKESFKAKVTGSVMTWTLSPDLSELNINFVNQKLMKEKSGTEWSR
jgi:hypothetical protein